MIMGAITAVFGFQFSDFSGMELESTHDSRMGGGVRRLPQFASFPSFSTIGKVLQPVPKSAEILRNRR
jgi:hypothetical protein